MLDLAAGRTRVGRRGQRRIAKLGDAVLELEYTLIPHGLHVVGEPPSPAERVDMLICAGRSVAWSATRARSGRSPRRRSRRPSRR